MASEGTIGYVMGEGQHWLSKSGNLLTAKLSLVALNGGQQFTGPFSGVLGAVFAVAPTVAGLATLSLVTAIGTASAQMDYNHDIHKITDTYRDQIAAQLKKPAHKVKDKDLYILAKGDAKHGIAANHVIAQELNKARAERTLGVGLAVGATLATLAIMGAVMTAMAASGVFDPHSAAVTSSALMSVGVTLAEGAAGLGLYYLLKEPLKFIGHKIFGLSHKTPHERIEHLKVLKGDGKTITREQILQVFAGADPKLDNYIKETYGAHFDKLDAEMQHKAAQDPQLMETLSRVAIAINEGKIKVGELAFLAEGKLSGAEPPKTKSRAPVEYDNPTPEKTFVARHEERQLAQEQHPSQTIH